MAAVDDLIRAARVRLGQHPLSAAFWAVRLEKTDHPKLKKTMGVSKDWTLYYGTEVGHWPIDTVCTVLIHEIWHLLRGHHKRGAAFGIGPLNFDAWNVATDAEINDGLVKAGMKFPPNITPVTPQALGMANDLLAEEYYQNLPQQHIQATGFGGSGADGIQRPWETGHGGQSADQTPGQSTNQQQGPAASAGRVVPEELIRKTVAEAIGKAPGNCPADWKRWAKVYTTPRTVPWQTLFRNIIGRHIAAGRKEDWSFSKACRRESFDRRLVLPGIVGTLPDVCVGIDTSGSMGEAVLAECLQITESVLEYLSRSYSLTVLAGDTEVHAVSKVTSASKANLVGGGGTNMGALIEYAANTLKPRPQILVLITDGYTPWPRYPPAGVHVIVVLVDKNGTVPAWAKSITIEPKGEEQ